MATQIRLSPTFHLDASSRDAGRRGLAKARAALAETVARTASERLADRDHEAGDGHAHAA